ncbi:MAG: glycosyltransferase family 4 protein [Egibacteraceae bacterium]
MRIALVCPYDWAKPGGVREHVAHLADYLAAQHEVGVFAPSSSARAVDERWVTVVGRPMPVRYNQSVAPVALSPLAGRKILRALRDYCPDVVHVHEPLSPIVSATAAAFGPRPVVGTFHAWSSTARIYRLAGLAGRRTVRRLDARIAVSPSAQQYAAGALRMPLGSFQVVPNGVDDTAFATAEPLPELVDPSRPLILFVGRLEPRKGVDVLMRAFLRLRASTPRVRLCVVGEGPGRERYQQMIPSSIRPDAQFVGAVDQAELPRYHASADIFVSPAVGGESFGVVLLEAMAAGLPVVASDIPGYRTVLKDGRQGRLVPPDDAFALAETVSTLLANEKLRLAMGAEGRQTAAEYAWPVIGRRIEAVYWAVRERT